MNGLTEDQERDYRATVQLRDRAEDISVYVATWQDAGHDGAHRRQALTDAAKAIDDMLLAAHELRQSLVTHARTFDDQAMRRSADLLERIRKERES